MRFEPGQKVRIKSGGPSMTVEYTDNEMVMCVYYDGESREVKRASININALVEDTD